MVFRVRTRFEVKLHSMCISKPLLLLRVLAIKSLLEVHE